MLKTRLGSNAMRHRSLQSSDDGLDPCQARRQWSNWNISTCRLAASAARFLVLLLVRPEPVGGAPSTAICSGLPVHRGPAHPLSPWGANHARPSTGHRFVRRLSGRRKPASKPIGSRSRHGISACSTFKDRRSLRPRWATPSMPGTATSKSAALAATPTRPSPSTSCGDRRQRRSMNWNATCAARTARRSGDIRTSAANPLRKIDQPPAHYTVDRRDRAALDHPHHRLGVAHH